MERPARPIRLFRDRPWVTVKHQLPPFGAWPQRRNGRPRFGFLRVRSSLRDGFSAQPPGRGLPRRARPSAPLRDRAAMRRSSVAALRPAGFDLRASLGCVRLVTLPRAPTRLRVRIDLDDDRALQLVSHLLDERRQGT